jgi:hypothetical protein
MSRWPAEQSSERRAATKKRDAARLKRYREAHREEACARTKAWRKAHPEHKARRRAHWNANRERLNALQRMRWNPEKQRSYRLKKFYGLTTAEFESMRAAQNGACAICNERFTRDPHIDHNHATGAVRELLCNNCNTGIGLFKENPERMEAAIVYLRKHNEPKLSLISTSV